MTKKLGLSVIVVLSVCFLENLCWAETVKLHEISYLKHENVSRIYFSFDRIPRFEIENSGQRVRVILAQTSFDGSFKKMTPDEVIFQIETIKNAQESIIELYCRNIPKYVDATVDKQNARLNINIFWDRERLGGRPAIFDQRIGEVKTSADGSVAQKMISSQYSGRWIDFFREYEWPVNFSLELNFAFPRFPSPLIVNNSESIPQELLQEESISFCDQAEKGIPELFVGNTKTQDPGLHELISAECFLRQKDAGQALNVLDRMDEEFFHESLIGWKRYYRSYAGAISGKYYQAANLLAGWEGRFRNVNGATPWCFLLQAELDLAKKKPAQVLELLSTEPEIDGYLAWLYNLRKADALYQLGRFDHAYAAYKNVCSDLDLLQQHPYSLANWADVLYKKKEYWESYRYYNLLSEGLKNEHSQQKALVEYQSAMAVLRSGDREKARLMFIENMKNEGRSEAGLRSWVKLIDLDLLSDSKPKLSRVLSEYNEIIKLGLVRKLREEAFFKQILASHLYGDDARAVKLLGRFFEDYWAGDLQPEAQAVFVEIFPKVVEELVTQDASFLALTLVAKHRGLLAQAPIKYDFLYNLAKSYSQAGFFEHAETTYLFILDFEKNSETKKCVFLPLIQVLYQQKKYEHVQKYASQYLKEYPEDTDRSEVLYHYADVLFKNGDVGAAVSLLVDKNRPKTKELDSLTGDMFFELGKFDLVEYYLSRVVAEDENDNKPEITLKRAEAFFFAQKLQNAIPLYESLLDKPRFAGQAGYRLIMIFCELDEKNRALKLYNQIAETEIEKQWLKLAEETIQTGNSIITGD